MRDNTTNQSRRPVRTSLAALAGTALLLAGCGDDDVGDAEQSFEELAEEMEGRAADPFDEAPTTDAEADADDDGGSGSLEVKPVTALLPEESEPDSGWFRVPASCAEPDESYTTWFTYAVPETWELTGRSSGGSGSPVGDSITLRFGVDGGVVTVESEPDRSGPDGTIVDHDGAPWESYDYDWSSSDGTSGTITFDEVGAASVGDQETEVWKADQAQEPDVLGSTTYKARLWLVELPNPAVGDDDGVRPVSHTVTVSHDAEDVELDDGVVLQIIESFAAPACTIERIVMTEEMKYGEDVDGDGKVATVDDLLDD